MQMLCNAKLPFSDEISNYKELQLQCLRNFDFSVQRARRAQIFDSRKVLSHHLHDFPHAYHMTGGT